MPADPVLVDPPATLHRVERIAPPLSFSRINAIDAALDSAGNRFDVPGATVLYAATTAAGAFAETLAVFRPSATLAAAIARAKGTQPVVGVVPPSWRSARRLRRFSTTNALPFVDIEHPASHAHLTEHAHELLLQRGITALDVATVRGPSRLLTRGLASFIYSQTDTRGRPRYGGIRYVSRLGDFECWAVFDGTAVTVIDEASIEPADHALREIATLFRLTVG